MNKIAYSYIRFSTPEQKKGASTSRQTQAVKDWCEKNGYTLSDETFTDEGKSAFKGKHLSADGDLKRFLSLVADGRIRPGAVLIVESFDRLSRLEPIDAVGLFTDIIRAGIGLVFTMTFDKQLITKQSLKAQPHLFYAILGEAQRAHYESKYKSERVKDAYDRRKERAKYNGHKTVAWCPPWCDFKGGEYVPNNERVEIVYRVYEEYLKGNGAFKICSMFNREKVPTLGHRGTKEYKNTTTEWYKKSIRDLLKDKRVYGFCEFLNQENYFPTVINEEKFKRIQSRLSQRAKSEPTGGPTDSVSNLFKGICRCVHCDSAMSKTSTNKKYKGKITKYDYFVCEGARNGMGCSYKSMTYNLLEGTFIGALQKQSAAILTGRTNNKEAKERLESLQGQFAGNEEKIARLVKHITEDNDAPKTLVAMLKALENEQVILTKSIQLAESQLDSIKYLPANIKEMVQMFGEYNEISDTKDGRLKLREHIQNTVSQITIDTKGVKDGDGHTINYVIHFKNSSLITVLIYSERQDHQQVVTVWQALQGIHENYDWTRATNFRGIGLTASTDEILRMIGRKFEQHNVNHTEVGKRDLAELEAKR